MMHVFEVVLHYTAAEPRCVNLSAAHISAEKFHLAADMKERLLKLLVAARNHPG